MDNKNIVLVGFMASGKTLVSKKLSEMLNRRRISTDDLIVEKEGKTITDIFNDSGEAYFRGLEKDIVLAISKESGIIVDCGGGIVLDQDNIDVLKTTGVIINLSSSPEAIYERVKGDTKRPLLNVEDPLAKIKELLEFRRPFYEKADYTIDTDHGDINRACEDIIKIIS